jgi:predicted cupin superfamily sugar epimerase
MEQIYFQFNNKHYKQKEGLAMGAPTSAILSEIYLQYIEHTYIYHTLQKHNITSYHRYVDDILITYYSTKTNINNTLEEFNNINKTLKFTMERRTRQQD